MTTIAYKNRKGVTCEYPQSFTLQDLTLLEEFLAGRDTFTMFEVAMGAKGIAIRHDVDHSLAYAVAFAKWERERGIRSTYFILPTAFYWTEKPVLRMSVNALIDMGHEVGIHNNALTAAAWDGVSVNDEELLYDRARRFLFTWIRELGDIMQRPVRGCAAHGSELSLDNLGVWGRWKLRDFGLTYEAYHLNEGCNYISDNRGKWRNDLVHLPGKPTRILIHPEHWILTKEEA